MKDIEKPEVVILAVLNHIAGRLPNDQMQIIDELINHNETGVALETLCSQAFEYGIELSEEHKARLRQVAFLLGIPLSQLDALSD